MWVTAFALRSAGALLERSSTTLHVNITPADLGRPDLPDVVRSFVRLRDLTRLVLEVTERAPLVASPVVEENLIALRRAGVRFAIDDLHDGWAGPESIRIVRPEIIKIRLHHLRGIAGAHEAARLHALVRDLHITVIVEQIEDAEDCALLRRLGLTHAQGWYWTFDRDDG